MDKSYDKEEPILNCSNRYVLFPVKYKDVYDMYKKHVSTFWVVEEIDFTNDPTDWKKLTDNDRHFIKYVLAFFAASDGIVNENLSMNFMNDVEIPEARAFYSIQSAIENIHSECYSLLIDTYIKDEEEKDFLFNAIRTIPCVKKKAEWALKWVNDENTSFAQRLLAFSIVEGIQFSGSFCAIFWLKEKGMTNGLTFSNELISRDEGLHVDFAVLLYKHLKNKVPEKVVYDMMKEAVEIEKEFITESIPCNLLGMNNDLMCQYIEYVADRLLTQLNYEKIYNTKNPFDFMERIALTNKANFFEQRVAEYSKANVAISNKNIYDFDLEADF